MAVLTYDDASWDACMPYFRAKFWPAPVVKFLGKHVKKDQPVPTWSACTLGNVHVILKWFTSWGLLGGYGHLRPGGGLARAQGRL